MPGGPGPDPGPFSPRIRWRDELLPQLSQGRGNGSGREPAARHPLVLGKKRDARAIRPGRDEQAHLRFPLPAARADERRTGNLLAADAAPAGGIDAEVSTKM